MGLISIVRFLFCIALLWGISIIQSCQRAGCDDESIIYKHRVLQEWGTSKYAYTGDETLVFYEIQNDDTAEVVFEPHNNFDTTFSDISWYQADNDDWCKGYVTDIDGRIDEYYCAERNWYFLAAQVSPKHEIKLEFRQKSWTTYDSNFFYFMNPEYMDSAHVGRQAHHYAGDTVINEIKHKEVTRLQSSYGHVYYGSESGVLEWEIYDRNYKLLLKQILR